MATNGVMEANGKCGHCPAPKTSVREKPLPGLKSITEMHSHISSDDDDDDDDDAANKYEGDR